MKKIIYIVLLSFTCITFAQNQREHHARTNQLTSEQRMILHTKQMVLELDMNESQHKQVLALNKKMAQNKENQKAAFKKAKENSETLSQDQIFNMKNDMLDTNIAHQAEMKKILSDKQFVQWRSSSKKMHHMKKRKMEKHKTEKKHMRHQQ